MTDDRKTEKSEEIEVKELILTPDELQLTVEDKLDEGEDLWLPPRRVRIEGQIKMAWGGVSSCCHSDRIEQAMADELETWIQRHAAERPRWRAAARGRTGGTVKCEHWTEAWPIDNRRGCWGKITVWAFVDFLWMPRRDDPENTDRNRPGGQEISPGAFTPWPRVGSG